MLSDGERVKAVQTDLETRMASLEKAPMAVANWAKVFVSIRFYECVHKVNHALQLLVKVKKIPWKCMSQRWSKQIKEA